MIRHQTILKVTTLVWAACLAWASHAGLRDFLDLRVVRPFELYARRALGREPAVDPRLKIISLDDKTAADLGDNRLPPKDLAALLRSLAAAGPSVILIDALFSSDADLTDDEAELFASLRDLPTRIVAGAAVSSVPNSFRRQLPTAALSGNWTESVATPPKGDSYVFGPAPKYLPAFRQIGHVVLADTLHFVPVMTLGDGTAVPHMALLAGEQRRHVPPRTEVDGALLPVDPSGRIPIDFVAPHELTEYSMRTFLDKARRGLPQKYINPGDVIVVLLNATTGSTDFYDSPYGRIRGGHILAANINSTLRRDWLQHVGFDAGLIVAAAVIGHVTGLFASASWFWFILGGIIACVTTSVALSFSFFGLATPSLLPLMACIVPSLSTYAYRRHQDSRRHLKLQLDVATAATLQRHFFPPPVVENERYELAAYYHPAEAIGGDWFAYYADPDHLTIHIGDVTGHGTPAALVASFAKGATDMVHADWAKRGAGHPPLGLVHGNLNDMIHSGIGDLAFMTMFSVSIDLKNGLIHFLNSGHRPGVLVDQSPQALSLFTPRSSTILGLEATSAPARGRTLLLAPGSTLLLLSDGLIDVPKTYGVHTNDGRLKKALARMHGLSAARMRDDLLKELKLDTAAKAAFVDDVTFIILKLKEPEALRLSA